MANVNLRKGGDTGAT